jgi:predicted GIY-YIG superfamily endonuclease
VALDVGRRLREHQSGRGSKYLRGRGPLQLVYARTFASKRRPCLTQLHSTTILPKQLQESPELELFCRVQPPVCSLAMDHRKR